jgi:hypothetical protein
LQGDHQIGAGSSQVTDFVSFVFFCSNSTAAFRVMVGFQELTLSRKMSNCIKCGRLKEIAMGEIDLYYGKPKILWKLSCFILWKSL